MSEKDVDVLARTIWAEARGEGVAGQGYGVAFSPDGTAITIAHATSPFISAYPWSSSGFGTKFANPATPPPNYANDVDFHPIGDYLAVAHNSGSYVSAYRWSSAGFGSKFSNPATPPSGEGNRVAFGVEL